MQDYIQRLNKLHAQAVTERTAAITHRTKMEEQYKLALNTEKHLDGVVNEHEQAIAVLQAHANKPLCKECDPVCSSCPEVEGDAVSKPIVTSTNQPVKKQKKETPQ